MLVLLIFAVLAGAGTALSPCVLPVLPALLSAGGVALGFVYTPCASPILAAVISVSAASGKTIVIAVAYAAGSALVLLAITLGGRRLFERVRRAGRGPQLQRALGIVMLLTAVAILTSADVSFDQFVARNIPDVNFTAGLECSRSV